MSSALRYGALLGIAVANTLKARRLRIQRDFERDLARQRRQLDSLPISFTTSEPDEPSHCGRTCTRLTGEVVICYLPSDHEGFHAGRAEGLAEAFTWPEKDSDGKPVRTSTPVECECNSSVLQGEIAQSADELWKWRIYDVGCDQQRRLFAVGASEDLDEARDDVVDTMRLLADNGGYRMTEPSHAVTHHVAAGMTYVGEQ